MIDEFSAVTAQQVARLFGRARSAGVSLILGTQELADLKSVGDGALREQTLGNVATVVAHRQDVPESAELIAAMAGTKALWITTQQTADGLIGAGPSGRGTRRRGYEFEIHPGHIKQLPTGRGRRDHTRVRSVDDCSDLPSVGGAPLIAGTHSSHGSGAAGRGPAPAGPP
jgi:conjugal transfer pilus assembly protein TraD